MVSPDMTEQPILLGLNTDERENASADMGGPDVNSAKQSEPVDRSGPVGPLSMTEQSALLGLKMYRTENTPVYQGGPAMISAGRGEPVNRSGPVASQSTYEQPALIGLVTDDRGNASTGPVGHDLFLAERRETVDRPVLVGPHNGTEQSVFLGFYVDRLEHAPASTVVPDVVMYRNQSFADRPAEQDETRRPVGTEWKHAENDANGPTAGGPVAQLCNADPLCPRGMPFKNDLLQPLAVGPVGQPTITGPQGKLVSEPDCRRMNRIHSGPGGSTGVLNTVNQTSSNVPTDRLNIGTFGRPANSADATPSSDSGVHSWKEQWENMSENSTEDASGQPVRSDCGSLGRVHMSDIRTPPNTEEEGDSDYPWMDRLVSRKLYGSSSDAMYGEDGRFLYSAVTGVGSDRGADIVALSDFSDDSEETEVGRLAGCRGPITGQPILVPDDVVPIPWDPPVDSGGGCLLASKVKMSYGDVYNQPCYRFKSSVLQWDREVLPEVSDPEFKPCANRLINEALPRDEDALVDSECPEVIRCFVKSLRMVQSIWGEHDARLSEQGTVCTTPGCQCYIQKQIMLDKFVDGILTDDSESEESADWDSTDSDSEGVVPRTYTPPPPEETQPEVCKPEET